jgi:MscS family membrane protein
VSLAAQGPIKNLFGSVTVVLDRPFGLGDRIKFEDKDGVVEVMGFRSTKLRTLDGHLVTIPNSKLIEDVVENITARPYLRRRFSVTITYDTPPDKVEQAVEIIQGILAEPFMVESFDLVEFPPRVSFNDFNADSLNILVVYWYQLNVEGRDFWTFNDQAQQFNMKLLRAYNDAGIDFAFPTQTLHLAGDPNRLLSVQVTGGENQFSSGNGNGPSRSDS